jgi:type IV secretion system protein VirB8
MNQMSDENLEEYYREAESWSQDRLEATRRSQRLAWIAAAVAATIAVVEALALVALIPLKRDVPYTLMVDSETGYTQALKPLENDGLTADAALTRSFLVQYVIARESFDSDNLQEDYRKVGLWSAGEAWTQYQALMNSSNAASPLASLPRRTTIAVQIRSVSSLSPSSAMVRFSTVRTDPGGRPRVAQHWAALINYRYSDADMTAGDRLTNPLGFQVTRYRRDAETLPEALPAALPEAPPIPSTTDDTAAPEAAE